MSRIAWVFYDPIEDESYSFPVNPNSESGSSVGVSKNINYSSVAGRYSTSNNLTIVYSSYNDIKKYSFSGFIYTQDQYNDLLY